MQDHTLRVGEELVIQGYVRLTVLAVDEDKVLFSIVADPNGYARPDEPPEETPPDGCASAIAERESML
jgi:hypothetical protein